MSKQVTLEGFVMFDPDSRIADRPPYRWVYGRPEMYGYQSNFVANMPLTFDLPEGFDPTAKQIAALEAEKARALAVYQTEVAALNEKISKLQAIAFDPA